MQLYQDIVVRLRPLGSQRAKILLKVVIMGIFVAFIFTVMETLGMNKGNTVFDAMKMIITVAAVTVPALIAKVKSTVVSTVVLMQKRGAVNEEVEKFLRINKTYYKYDFKPVSYLNSGEKLEGSNDDDKRDFSASTYF